MDAIVSLVHTVLKKLGWPANDLPDGEMIALSFFSAVGTLVFYYIAFGRRHVKRRAQLSQELQTAIDHVLQLQEKLDILEAEEQRQRQLAEKANKLLNKLNENENKQIRVFMDGAFDMMHYGHMNAFRLGRSLGNYLVVGVNTDASITECKGTAPIMNDEERTAAVTACRWVDEVVKDCPYVMTAEYLSWVVKTYNIDYVVHGDDPCIVDGKDVYQEAKDRGIYRSIPRTEGVSTTDIVGRMLYITRDHHEHIPKSPEMGGLASKSIKKSGSASSLSSQLASAGVGIEDITTNQTTLDAPASPRLGASSQAGQFIRRSNFLTTSRIMRIFASGVVEPSENAKIVYVDGAFDLFHQGHIEFLKAAREFGDYLIVGVHNDDLVNKHRRHNYPILNLNERVLSLLGCRYVDDVLIDAPWEITREMVASLKISVVVAGTISDCEDPSTVKREKYYQVPKELGIFKEVKSTSTLTVGDIVERVLNNEGLYKQKVKKKMAAENDYYSKRYGFDVSQQGKAIADAGSGNDSSSMPPIKI